MKNIKKILLLIICCLVNIDFCYAEDFAEVNVRDISDNTNSNTNTEENKPIEHSEKFNNNDKYTCYYQYYLNYGSSLRIYGYNLQNDVIIKGTVNPQESIRAGMSIGLGIIETERVSWDITKYWVTKKGEKLGGYTFKKTILSTGKEFTCISYIDGVIKSEQQCIDEGFRKETTTEDGVEYTWWPWYEDEGEVTTNEKMEECKIMAENYVKNIAKSSTPSASYEVTLNDPNNANSNVNRFEVKPKMSEPVLDGNSYVWTFTYTPEYVCIDKKNATIFYSDTRQCSSDEFQIMNDVSDSGIEHFHYFVPLNVTDSVYSLLVNPKTASEKKSVNSCVDAINSNNNYYDFLFTSTGGTYKPISKTKSIAINEVSDGCYVRTEIKIPVSNGIYNVENNKISGYNLYVKNVDESNPFPNPIVNEDSLWFDWYNNNYSGKGNYAYNNLGPNIKESFSETSYEIHNVNAKNIRSLNLGNYFNNSVNISGKSDFIGDTIEFQKRSYNYSKLGCGPLNSTETISDGISTIVNPLYQEGCG